MKPAELAEGLRIILEHSPAFPDKKLVVDVIANPKAGGFRRHHIAARRAKELQEIVGQASALPLRLPLSTVHLQLHLTQRCGHAAAIAQRLIDKDIEDGAGDDSLHLLVTAGGDGTSLETAERLIALPAAMQKRFAILRLPFGTGNDGSEGRDLVTALGRFLGPLRFEKRNVVKIMPAAAGGRPSYLAFNIASIGLDAYVADKTNRLKLKMPGDSYKFWVNVATLFYGCAYRILPMRLQVWNDKGEQILDNTGARLFIALGATGHRQYGSNKRILPDDNNGIAVSQTSLFRKLLVKGKVEKGNHDRVREVVHFMASRIEISNAGRIPLQRDGEVEVLGAHDFPLVMEVVREAYDTIVPIAQN